MHVYMYMYMWSPPMSLDDVTTLVLVCTQVDFPPPTDLVTYCLTVCVCVSCCACPRILLALPLPLVWSGSLFS